LHLTAREARTLIGMTPSAHHDVATPNEDITVTASIQISAYSPL
jgi:23S rRNA (guanine745-N1)-methyltransferase